MKFPTLWIHEFSLEVVSHSLRHPLESMDKIILGSYWNQRETYPKTSGFSFLLLNLLKLRNSDFRNQRSKKHKVPVASI